MNQVTQPLSSADISIFSLKISKFGYIKKYRCRLHLDTNFYFLTFFESLKIALINMVTILMMSPKMATLSLLKIKLFWNKDYDVIISVREVTTKFYHVNQIML